MRSYFVLVLGVSVLACGGGSSPQRPADAAPDAKDAPAVSDLGSPDLPADQTVAVDVGQDADSGEVGGLIEIYLQPSNGEFRACVGREMAGIEFRTPMPGAESFRPYLAVLNPSDSTWEIRSNTCANPANAGTSCTVFVVFNPSVSGEFSASLTVSDSADAFNKDTVLLKGTAEVCD